MTRVGGGGEQTFNDPAVGSCPLDGCLYLQRECGEPAASAWCASKGLGKATNYTGWRNVPKTCVIGDGSVCNAGATGTCGTFTSITCSGAGGVGPGPGGEGGPGGGEPGGGEPGGGEPGGGEPGGGEPGGGQPGGGQPGGGAPGETGPCTTSAGQACFEKWIADFSMLANAYSGTPGYNGRKPWSIGRYGLIEGGTAAGPHSVFAPDDYPQYGNNRYCWMWGHDSFYSVSPWSEAGIPALKTYITSCMGPTN